MSKFHAGDKVRVYAPGSKFNDSIGWVLHEPRLTNLMYLVELDMATPPGEDSDYEFAENELRPADIFAQEKERINLVENPSMTETTDVWYTGIQEAVDVVNHPPHYNRFQVEVINITEQLDFNRGNAVKYLARAGFKEGVDEMEDLQKAAWYVNRAIEKLTKERESDG